MVTTDLRALTLRALMEEVQGTSVQEMFSLPAEERARVQDMNEAVLKAEQKDGNPEHS